MSSILTSVGLWLFCVAWLRVVLKLGVLIRLVVILIGDPHALLFLPLWRYCVLGAFLIVRA
jgi:hypothetical protein